jgi:hypothetical protein
MSRVYPIKPCLGHGHQGKGELANEYLKGCGIFLGDKPFPERIGWVPALIDDHAIHLAHEDHELGVDLGHFLEVLVVEVQVVVYLLFGEDVFLDLLPVDEAQALFVLQVETFRDEFVDTAVFILGVGDLVLSCEILP